MRRRSSPARLITRSSSPFGSPFPAKMLAIMPAAGERFDTSRALNSHRSRAGGAPGKGKVVRPSAKIPIAASCVVGKLK